MAAHNTPVPDGPTPLLAPMASSYMWYTDIHASKISTHKIQVRNLLLTFILTKK